MKKIILLSSFVVLTSFGTITNTENTSSVKTEIDAASLTRYEAAGIAAILPNPRKYKASNSSSYINRRKAKISREIGYVKLDY